MDIEEIKEKIEHSPNRRVALLIAVLALALAFFESLGKSYQTDALSLQVESANLWSFYQAKSIKAHATELARGIVIEVADKAQLSESEALKKWADDVERLTSNDVDKDGKHQLFEKAKEVEAERNLMFKKYRYMEIASAILQVSIVLASAAIITSAGFLVTGACALGVVATAVGLVGLFVPSLI